jgi:NAD(P)-dependent dehydrogenase (short-subunit alcohol dehydrogenase family)
MTAVEQAASTERVGVVTGGAGAIGSAIVHALRAAGHRVVVLDRDGDVDVDLSDEQSTRRAAAQVLERFGRCDVFVHAAAAFDLAALGDLDVATWRRVQAVNVESALWLAQAFAPGMAERAFGRIVFVTSDTLWDPPAPMLLPYVASKGALVGIMRTLARALGPDGIAVTAVAPGLTDTPASRTVNTDAQFDAVVHRQALTRRLTPADTAAAVAFLASDAAAALTGQALCVDGGLILR